MIKQEIVSKVYRNATIVKSGIVMQGFRLVKNSIFSNTKKIHFYKYALYKKFTLKTLKLSNKEKTQYYMIHNHWSNGYHHWLTESLTRLIHVEDYQTKTLIIPEEYPKFTFESLTVLGVKNIYKIPIDTNVKITRIEIPENPNSGFYSSKHLKKIRSLLLKNNTPKNIPRIYITRKNAPKRKIENENELTPILRKYGFEIIDADHLSFHEQIALFSSCSFLISIHGAALTNCIFMPKNSVVLEFYKKNTFINHCYERMSEALSLKHTRFLCDGGFNSNTHVDQTDLVVNKEKFEFKLKQLLA